MTFSNKRQNVPFEWKKFLEGSWQKEMPSKRQGRYPVATRDGELAGEIPIWQIHNDFIPAKNWDGWWWSEPIPSLNRPFKKWNES